MSDFELKLTLNHQIIVVVWITFCVVESWVEKSSFTNILKKYLNILFKGKDQKNERNQGFC